MRVFESTTNPWQSLANPSNMLEDEYNDGIMSIHVSSLMFEGLLYILFTSYEGKEYWLFSYNPLEDMWKDTGTLSCWHRVQLDSQ